MENNINTMYIIKKNISFLESNYKQECIYLTYNRSSNTFEEISTFNQKLNRHINELSDIYILENNKIYHKPRINIIFTSNLSRLLVFDTDTLLDNFIKQLENDNHYLIYSKK